MHIQRYFAYVLVDGKTTQRTMVFAEDVDLLAEQLARTQRMFAAACAELAAVSAALGLEVEGQMASTADDKLAAIHELKKHVEISNEL